MGVWYWAGLAGIFCVYFGVGETLGLLHKRGWLTLSTTLRKVLGVRPHRPWQVPAVILFVGLLGWLILHITTSAV